MDHELLDKKDKENDIDFYVDVNGSKTDETRIRIFGWSPDCLQCFNSLNWFLFTLALASLTQGIVINGLSVVSIPTIEKEFGISSKSAGVIVAGNDASALLLVGVVSFFGTKAHKPKWIGIGVLLTGLGGFLFALPKLLIDPYEPVGETKKLPFDMCYSNKTLPKVSCEANNESLLHVAILFIAQFIMGAGVTPLYTLGPAFLDENVDPKSSPIYLGVWFVSSMLGPGLGFLIGGQFLKVFTNIEKPAGISLKPSDPRWIGAWWLGFIVISTLFFVSGFLLMMFPKSLPNSKEKREEAIKNGALPKSDPTVEYSMKGLFKELIKILLNKVYILAVLGLTVRLLFVIGMASFLVKILIVKFGVPPYRGSTLIGMVMVPSMTCGILIGAFLMKRIKLKIAAKTAAKICLIISLINIPVNLIYIIPSCQTSNLAGVQVPYSNTTMKEGVYSFCNDRCRCQKDKLSPVCGSDGITYSSPCFAGCSTMSIDNDKRPIFGNCTCINKLHSLNAQENSKLINANFFNYAKLGVCDRSCKNLTLFTIILIIGLVISFIAGTPHKILLLRSVPDNQRSFALGIQFFLMRTLAFLPAPIVMGFVVDSQCISWKYDACGAKKNCADYHVGNLSTNISSFGVAATSLASLFYGLIVLLSRKSNIQKEPIITNEEE